MIKIHRSIEQSVGRWVFLVATLLLTTTLQAAQVGIDWQWAHPKPHGNPYNAIAYNSASTTSLAVGDLGEVVASSDAGVTWTAQTSGTVQRLNGVREWGIGFVAVGDQGTILASFTSPTWGAVTSGTTASLNDIVRNGTTSGSLFIVVGGSGTILSSTDGLNWSTQVAPAGTGNLMSVAWSSPLGLFAAVSDSGKILASVDGINWTFEYFTAPVNGFTAPSGFRAVTWDSTNSQFVAVGVSGIVETSTDGTNWSQQSAPTTTTLTGVAQQGATLVAVGKFGSIETSTNGGVSWTEQFSGPDLQGVTSDGSQFLAVGHGGRVLGSSNGVTWSQQQPTTSLTNTRINDLAWNGTRFLAVGNMLDGSGNPSTLSSTDGVSWNLNGGSAEAPTEAVVWDGSQFVGVSLNSIYTSSNGAIWAGNIIAIGIGLADIAWDGAQFTAVGIGGVIFTSPDTVTWTARTSGISNALNAASGNGSITVVVGDDGALLNSSNGGANWSVPSVPALGTTSLFDVTWNGTQFIAVGDGGTILTSSDGTNWTSQTSGTTDRLRGVFWDGAQFIVVSGLGNIITSPDGVTWTSQTSGTTNVLTAVAGTSTRLAAVGWDGTILTSAGSAPSTSSVSTSGGGGCTLNPRTGFDPMLLLWLLISGAVLLRRKPVQF